MFSRRRHLSAEVLTKAEGNGMFSRRRYGGEVYPPQAGRVAGLSTEGGLQA
jgi:hypothetical protein